jgi:demethylmenaquinone methyltransferase/2-methoxy-6-polyprenyl-1,4-benzoquinol methylase
LQAVGRREPTASREPITGPMSPLPLDKQPDRIRTMFDAIARRYDLLNHLLSAGLDRRWRSRAVQALALSTADTLLDVCTGTGDVVFASLASSTPPALAIGVDFAGAMLDVARAKAAAGKTPRAAFVRGDALHLPVATGSVAAVTIAFGMRNVQHLDRALAEVQRVLRPGGRLAVLEFGRPTTPGVRCLYARYFAHVLPRVGRVISGHRHAYSYLNASVEQFPSGEGFATVLQTAGFSQVTATRLTLGIVYLYMGRRRP